MDKYCAKCKKKTYHWYIGTDEMLTEKYDCSKCAEKNEDKEDFNGLDVGF